MIAEGRGAEEGPIFIFDFGGVVIKWKNNNPIFDQIARNYNVPRMKMRRVLEDSLPRLERGEVSIRDFLREALGKFGRSLRKNESPELLWTRPFEQRVRFRLGTLRIVKSLRRMGFKVYMFSNTSAPHARLIRKKGWDKLFDGFLASCDLGSVKPDGTAFAKALDAVGAKPSHVVFIDDKAANVSGAKEFGIRWAFTFTTLASLKKDLASLPRGT